MKEFISHPLGVALVLLPMSIAAKNLFGAGNATQVNQFNWNYLKRGLFKGLLIYLGIGVLSAMAILSKDLKVSIAGMDYTLIEGCILIIGGATLVYLKDTFVIFGEIFNQKTTEEIEYKKEENE